MFKKVVYVFLSFLMLLNLSGCNTEKVSNETIPVYTEMDIGSQLGLSFIGQIKMNSKNQLVVYGGTDKSQGYWVIDEYGNKLNEIKCDFTGDGSIFAIDSKDNLYVLVQNMKVDKDTYKVTENTKRLLVFNLKGEKLKDIELGTVKIQKDEDIAVRDMVVDSNGNINLVKFNESLEIIDENGKMVNNPYQEKSSFLDIDDEGNLITGSTGITGVKSSIAKVNPKDGNKIWKKDLDVGVYIRSVDYNSSEKCIYALMDNCITKYNSQRNSEDKIFAFIKYGLMSDKIHVNGMVVDAAGNIYLSIWGDNNGSAKSYLKKFVINKPGEQSTSNTSNTSSTSNTSNTSNNFNTAPAKEIITLTLAAHFSDRWLETAVGNFQSSHPGIEINIKDYKGAFYGGGDTPAEANKRADEFVKTINTELMAGKGPDIIYFTELPYRKYVDKNAFCNLTELMEKDKSFQVGELNMNILNALKYKGALYTMPVNYQFDILIANKAILDKESIKIDDANWTWKDFMDIAQKVSKDLDNDGVLDQFAFPDRRGSGIFTYMLNDRYHQFIDLEKKKADLMNPEFINLLNISKVFADKKLTFEGDWNAIVEKTSRGGCVFTFGSVPGYSMIKYYKDTVFAGDVYLLRFPSDGNPGSRVIKFGTGNMFAINNNSKFKNEAWEFMKLLLSKDMQSSFELQNGFPVNNEALKESAKFCVDTLKMPKEYIDVIDRIIPEVSEYDYNDQQVNNILKEETGQFFAGKKSAEDTAKAIQNKVSTHLGE